MRLSPELPKIPSDMVTSPSYGSAPTTHSGSRSRAPAARLPRQGTDSRLQLIGSGWWYDSNKHHSHSVSQNVVPRDALCLKNKGTASFELYNFDWDGLLISSLKTLELRLGNSWFSQSVCPFKLRIYMWKWHPFFPASPPAPLTLPIGIQRKLVVRKNEAYIQRETRMRRGERASWVLSGSIVLGSRPFLRSRCILALGSLKGSVFLYKFVFLLIKSSRILLHANHSPNSISKQQKNTSIEFKFGRIIFF